MRLEESTVGVTVRPMPKGLKVTVVVPSPCGSRMGSSPPARKLALWPDSATSVGSASTRAMPLLCRMSMLASHLPGIDSAISLNAEDSAPPLLLPEGAVMPYVKPPLVLLKLMPICRSTFLLNSTTFTSTCTTPPLLMVDASLITPFSPIADVAALRLAS
ncbi:hypothetical protein D3C81_942840 [compost metagenome]